MCGRLSIQLWNSAPKLQTSSLARKLRLSSHPDYQILNISMQVVRVVKDQVAPRPNLERSRGSQTRCHAGPVAINSEYLL